MEDNLKLIRLNIEGMTCVNCQSRIEEALQKHEGVFEAYVDLENSVAKVVCHERITREELVLEVEALGYTVLAPTADPRKKILYAGILLLAILVLYCILSVSGLLNLLVPSQLADSGMGYGMIFVIGLFTSVHCIAMCGGINLSQSLPKDKICEEKKKTAILPAIMYNAGRVASYTVIGFIMGLIGFAVGGGSSNVGIPVILQSILKFIAGILMVVMGLNMLNIFPWLRRLIPHMPSSIAKKINRKKREGGSSFIVGLLNGIMPCGPLQSMWVVALATGNPFAGALSMLLFALGTVPLMLGLGAIVAKLGQKFAKTVMTVGSALVVVLGLAMISQGGAMIGWLSSWNLLFLFVPLFAAGLLFSMPFDKKTVNYICNFSASALTAVAVAVCIFQPTLTFGRSDGDVSVIEGDIQTVTSTLSSRRYPEITVTEGIPVKWVITAPSGSITGCNNRMLIPEYEIEYTFQYGENIIEFTPEAVGTYNYSCWMGMIYGKIIVIEEKSD